MKFTLSQIICDNLENAPNKMEYLGHSFRRVFLHHSTYGAGEVKI